MMEIFAMQLKHLIFLPLTLCFLPVYADSNASYPPNHEGFDSPSSPISSVTAQVALEWITLLDQMRYDISWSEAGSMLKDTVARDQWVAAMDITRRPLGYNSARRLRAQRSRKILSYGTVGEFMVNIYDSSFLGRSNAQEICILMREKDNSWRVVSYNIK